MADETKSDDATQKSSKKRSGVSNTMPKGDARALGTPAPKRSHKKKAATSDAQTIPSDEKKPLDSSDTTPADSSSTQTSANNITNAPSHETGSDAPQQKEENVMASLSLSLDSKQRKSTSVVYKLGDGIRGSVRIAKTAFTGGTAPTSLSLQSDQENAFATPKAKLTAEQRKELRKNAPKLTPAQKLAKLQERAAKLQEKIAAAAAAPAAPAAEPVAQS